MPTNDAFSQVNHEPAPVERLTETARYSFRNWSYEYRCPVCGRAKRLNRNYLGQRSVSCDGVKFTITKKEESIL